MSFGRFAVELRGATLILRRQPEFFRDEPLLVDGPLRWPLSSRPRLLCSSVSINHLRLAWASRPASGLNVRDVNAG